MASNYSNEAAAGGLMGYAGGGEAKQARYLSGDTDGMADEINTTIDDRERAKLSHGEFVIPADVVSHMGNGNSDAGAKKLYDMMSKIRKARTGNPKQGKQINPDKFTGGIAGYAMGGNVTRLGVEYDSSGAIVAYQILRTHPGEMYQVIPGKGMWPHWNC